MCTRVDQKVLPPPPSLSLFFCLFLFLFVFCFVLFFAVNDSVFKIGMDILYYCLHTIEVSLLIPLPDCIMSDTPETAINHFLDHLIFQKEVISVFSFKRKTKESIYKTTVSTLQKPRVTVNNAPYFVSTSKKK